MATIKSLAVLDFLVVMALAGRTLSDLLMIALSFSKELIIYDDYEEQNRESCN
jgi:hypothetical protein